MAKPRSPGEGKAPVEIFHFPKPEGARGAARRSPAEGRLVRTTLTDFSELKLDDADELTPPPLPVKPAPRRRRSSDQPARSDSRGRAHAPSRRRSSLEIADPQRLPTVKTRALPREPPVGASRSMSRAQIAEMSLFGHQLFENGKLTEARGVFEGLVAQGIKDPFPHTMLGTIYMAQGEPDRALALFEAALAIDPGDLAARVYRGEIRLFAGRLRPALQDLRRALDLGSRDDPFVERARRLIQVGEDRARRSRR